MFPRAQTTDRNQKIQQKNSEVSEKKSRFQCKCHWTPDKENLYNELHNMKVEINKLKNEKQQIMVKSVRYEKDCKQFEKIAKNNTGKQRLNQANFLYRSQFDQSKNTQFQQIQEQNEQIMNLEKQLNECKKDSNYSRLKELEIQNEHYAQELKKLNQEIKQNIIQQKFSNNGEKFKNQQKKDLKDQTQILQKQTQQIQDLNDRYQMEQENQYKLQEKNQKITDRLKILEKQVFLKEKISNPLNDCKQMSQTPSRLKLLTVQNKQNIGQQSQKQFQSMKEQCYQSHLQKLQYKEIMDSFRQIKQQIGEDDNNNESFVFLNQKDQPSKQEFMQALQKNPFNFTIYKSKQLADYIFQKVNIVSNKESIMQSINQYLKDDDNNQSNIQIQLKDIFKCNDQFLENFFLLDENINLQKNDIFQLFKENGIILSTDQFNYIIRKLFIKQKKVIMRNLQQLVFYEFISHDLNSYKSSQKFNEQDQEIIINDNIKTQDLQNENQDIIINDIQMEKSQKIESNTNQDLIIKEQNNQQSDIKKENQQSAIKQENNIS